MDLSAIEKQPRFLKAAFIFGVLLAVAFIIAILRLPVILIVGRAHMFQRSFPELSQLPVPLGDTSATQAKGIPLSAFGWEFEAPWQRVSNTRKLEQIESTSFEGGQSVALLNPRDSLAPSIGQVAESKKQRRQSQFEAEYGKDATTSDYDFENALLNTRVEDLSLFMSYKRAQRNWSLLFLKSLDLPSGNSGLFSFSFVNLHGFQIGDPARTRRIVIHGYDLKEHAAALIIWINGQSSLLQQSEINRILKTLHFVSTPSQP